MIQYTLPLNYVLCTNSTTYTLLLLCILHASRRKTTPRLSFRDSKWQAAAQACSVRQRTEAELPQDDYSDEEGEANDDEDEDSESQVLEDDSSHSASEGSEEYESEKEESD